MHSIKMKKTFSLYVTKERTLKTGIIILMAKK